MIIEGGGFPGAGYQQPPYSSMYQEQGYHASEAHHGTPFAPHTKPYLSTTTHQSSHQGFGPTPSNAYTMSQSNQGYSYPGAAPMGGMSAQYGYAQPQWAGYPGGGYNASSGWTYKGE